MAETQNFEAFLEDVLAKEEADVAQSPASNDAPPIKSIESEEAAPRRNPFKFLDAFTPNDRDIFFGRDLEIKELYRAVFSHKVSVVFGSSGAGKTSLVQCGLFARLKPEKTAYFVIRSAIQPLLSVKNDCTGKIGVYDPDKDLFHNLTHAAQSLKKTLILGSPYKTMRVNKINKLHLSVQNCVLIKSIRYARLLHAF